MDVQIEPKTNSSILILGESGTGKEYLQERYIVTVKKKDSLYLSIVMQYQESLLRANFLVMKQVHLLELEIKVKWVYLN
jgi:transcriptional regulator with PAS, ATPase and Fis domain